MKAQELRIGNIVNYYGDDFPNGTQCTVDSEDIRLMDNNPVYASEHKPILLTEEWLIKFGFKNEVGNEWAAAKGLFVIEKFDLLYNFSAGSGCALSRSIKYVHELQNLFFAITGQELTIK